MKNSNQRILSCPSCLAVNIPFFRLDSSMEQPFLSPFLLPCKMKNKTKPQAEKRSNGIFHGQDNIMLAPLYFFVF